MSKNKYKNQKGFTLTELLIVLVILGGLMAIVAPSFFGQRDKANFDTAKLKIGQLMNALENFYNDCSQYPESLDQLLSAPSSEVCENWGLSGKYVKNEKALMDPWKNPFSYEIENGEYNIVSYGKDKAPGGEGTSADISSNEI